MAISDAPWDGSAARYANTDAYCTACLIDLNEAGKDKTQANCKLPVKSPDGTVNRNAVHAAAAALAGGRGGVQAPAADKKKAARTLLGYYREMKEEPPASLKQIAGM